MVMLVAGMSLTAGVGNVAAAGDVTITVNNQFSETVEGATVEIYSGSSVDTTTASPVQTATTGTGGQVTFAGLSDGDYTVKATSPSGNYTMTKSGVDAVTVSGSNVSDSINVDTYGTMEVNVIGADTLEGVSDTTVEIIDPDGNVIVDGASTDSGGIAFFEYVKAGTYEVQIASNSQQYVGTTMTVDVVSGESTPVNAELTPKTEVGLNFVGPDGEPETAGFVDLENSQGELVRTYSANQDGTQTAYVDPEKSYTLVASDEGGNYETASLDISNVSSDTTYEIQYETADSDATTSINDASTSDSSESSSGDELLGGGSGSVGGFPIEYVAVGVLALFGVLGIAAVRD
jgi:hypothetical protein